MLTKLWSLLQGKKSYIVAVLSVLYAVLAVYFHQMDWQQAVQWVFGAGALVAVKSALVKLQ
jgi:type IV secretory pathway VirB2 component (pilin)